MKDLFSYINEKGNISFAEMPFNEVDSAILSQISYYDLFRYNEKLPFFLKDIPKKDYSELVKGVWDEGKNIFLLRELAIVKPTIAAISIKKTIIISVSMNSAPYFNPLFFIQYFKHFRSASYNYWIVAFSLKV